MVDDINLPYLCSPQVNTVVGYVFILIILSLDVKRRDHNSLCLIINLATLYSRVSNLQLSSLAVSPTFP